MPIVFMMQVNCILSDILRPVRPDKISDLIWTLGKIFLKDNKKICKHAKLPSNEHANSYNKT